MRNWFAATAVATLALAGSTLAGSARAEVLHYMAMMDAATEVPPHAAPGKGMVMADLDTVTKTLTYKGDFTGLTGPATMGHFHGPALPGVSAPPVVLVAPIASPFSGAAVLTDAQIADLEAGKWYFNVHTEANKAGEIRGQVVPMK